jgi:hypothetical protein
MKEVAIVKQKQNSAFVRLYLFALKAKTTTGIYFMGFVCFYFVIGALSGNVNASIGIWKTMQMVAACILIGFGQAAIVPTEKFSIPRAVCGWAYRPSLLRVHIVFWWFEGFPSWSGLVF